MKRSNETEDENAVLSLRNVGVSYCHRTGFLRRDRFTALRDVSFNLHHGESLGVIGNNGAGKSTLLKVLNGIILPDCGDLINRGYSTALLSLNLGFDPNLSGRDNAIMSGLLLGFRRKQVEQCLGDIIAFSELADCIDYPLHTYSTGMRIRLGFAVALRLKPEILLIDEVLAVGDAEFQAKSQAEIERTLVSDRSVVFVSHDPESVRRLCNRVVWLERGETLIEGDASDVVRAYEKYMQLEPKTQIEFLHTHNQIKQAGVVEDLPTLLQEVIDTLSENGREPVDALRTFRHGADLRLREDAELH